MGADSEYGIGIVNKKYSEIGFTVTLGSVETFSEFFRSRFGDRKTRAFAEKTGASQSAVSKAMNGKAPPPERHIEAWIRELGLSDEDARRFRDLAADRRIEAKSDARDRFAELQSRLEQQDAILRPLLVALLKDSHKLSQETRSLVKKLKESL